MANTDLAVADDLPPVDLARRLFDLLNEHDLAGASDRWHDDIREDFVAVSVFTGKREVRGFFEEIFAAFPDFTLRIESVVGDETTAFIQWVATGTFSGKAFQGVFANGNAITLRGVDVMEFQEQKLLRNTIYYDGAGFARSLGLLPPKDSAVEVGMKAGFNAMTAFRKRLGRP